MFREKKLILVLKKRLENLDVRFFGFLAKIEWRKQNKKFMDSSSEKYEISWHSNAVRINLMDFPSKPC